jgi:hypothetical protein
MTDEEFDEKPDSLTEEEIVDGYENPHLSGG